MPSAAGGGSSANPYNGYDNDAIERDLIDPDDGMPAIRPTARCNILPAELYWTKC